MQNSNDKTKGFLFLAMSGILCGLIVFGGSVFSSLGLSLFQISTIPYILASLFVVPFLIKIGFKGVKENLKILIFYAIVSEGVVLCQFGGVVFGASVAVVVLLLYAQPLWTILISHFFLKEKVSKYQIIAGILVLVGVVFLVNPFEITSSSSLLGVIFALFGGVFLSLWIVVGSVASKRKLSPLWIFFFGSGVGALVYVFVYPLMVLFAPFPNVIGLSLDFPLFVFALIILFSLVPVIGAHLLYYAGAKRVSTITAGILMLLEPVSGVVLSVIFLAQPLTLPVIIGGFLILLGNIIVITKGQ